MLQPPVRKVEFSRFFWKNMADWRQHPDIGLIRRNIASVVDRRARGEMAGDVPFKGGQAWNGILHAHVGKKLTLFTAYPSEGVMRICALTKHDFYGFGSERSSIAGNAIKKIRSAIASDPVISPEWTSFRWSSPSDVLRSPEVPELAPARLQALAEDLLVEGHGFERFHRFCAGMTDADAERASDIWIGDLVAAQERVHRVALEMARAPGPFVPPEHFAAWSAPSQP